FSPWRRHNEADLFFPLFIVTSSTPICQKRTGPLEWEGKLCGNINSHGCCRNNADSVETGGRLYRRTVPEPVEPSEEFVGRWTGLGGQSGQYGLPLVPFRGGSELGRLLPVAGRGASAGPFLRIARLYPDPHRKGSLRHRCPGESHSACA